MNKIKQLWNNLRESFWFVPSLILAASVALAVVLIGEESTEGRLWLSRWPRLFGAGAAGARGMLTAIAGSTMTVVGVMFSMILVTLALASSQYTSRILRNFMRDRITQVVLGIFVGMFAYCLIVLRTIRGGDEGAFVPSLAVFFGFVFALGGVGALVFFIQHVALSIEASNVVASVAGETIVAVDRWFPDRLGQGPREEEPGPSRRDLSDRNWRAVRADRTGYIQSVDNAALLRFARERKTLVQMERGIGDFVVQDTPLVSVAQDAEPDRQAAAALRAVYRIGRHRTVEQDAAYGIGQIVDVALKGLSPGINDVTTAVTCVDYLTAILARLAARQIPSSCRYEEKALRVIAIGPTFGDLVALSFDRIRGSAGGNAAILLRLLAALQAVASVTKSADRRRTLQEHMQRIAELAERTLDAPCDRDRFERRLAQVRDALETTDQSTQKAVTIEASL